MVPSGTIPFTPLVGVILNGTEVHVVKLIGVIVATGLMITVNVNDAPVQFPDNGVTR